MSPVEPGDSMPQAVSPAHVPARLRQLVRPLATAMGLLGCAVVAIGFTPTWNFLAYALAGSGLIVWWVPARRPPAWATALGCLGAVLLWASSAPTPLATLAAHPETVVALGGLGATAALLATRPVERLALIGALGIPAFVVVSGFLFIYTWSALPLTFDAYLFAADRALGLAPAYVVGTWFREHPLLAAPSWLLYMTLPLFIALAYAAAARGRIPGLAAERVFLLCAAVGLVGGVLYYLYPAAGPRHAFDGFPALPPSVPVELLAVPAGAPRNAMPSLHLTWALLLWRLSRRGPRWLVVLATAWLIGTTLSTLGLGEHYAIDLVVALPFALGMEAVCRWALSPLVLANAGVVAAWIVGLRAAATPGAMTMWGGVIVTLALAYALGRELDRAPGGGP